MEQAEGFPDRLTITNPESGKALQGVLLSRLARFEAEPQSNRGGQGDSGWVPLTVEQWKSVLLEAGLPQQWTWLRDATQRVVSCRDRTSKSVGRRLPGWADEMCELWASMHATLGEMTRFLPPDDQVGELALAEQLVDSARRLGAAVLGCAINQWDAGLWETARLHRIVADETSTALLNASCSSVTSTGGLVYERWTGLSTAELAEGDGFTFTARLTAAWSSDQEELDQRLRRQSAHLINSSTTLTPSLRRHLVHLGTNAFPLEAHRVAIETRDLVVEALKSDEAGCLRVLQSYWEAEPEFRMAFAGVSKAYEEISASQDDEYRLDSVTNVYRYAMEGDVRRTARVTLALMNFLPPTAVASRPAAVAPDRYLTLGPLLDLLRRHPKQPICVALASSIKTAWRNPIGHCEVSWDAERGTALLAGEPVDWEDLLTAAEWSQSVCRAFDHGVEVALAVATLNDPFTRGAIPESTRNLLICDAVGSTGVRLLKLRRAPGKLTLTVRNITSRNILDLLGAVAAAAPHAPEVARWEIREEGGTLPLLVDRAWVEAVLGQVGEAGEMLLPDDVLPLMMNVLLNAEIPPALAACSVIEVGAVQVLGEADLLTGRLKVSDSVAMSNLLLRVEHVRRAIQCTAKVLGFEVGSNILRYFERQLAQVERDVRTKPGMLVLQALQPIRDVLRARHVDLPWPPG
ncbi:hypothetical protein [Streptomyces parvus]|uniref:hypothetical protein n=1 Tax=Streptomyces parvus TaxID=66428 RepID=UPI0038167B41